VSFSHRQRGARNVRWSQQDRVLKLCCLGASNVVEWRVVLDDAFLDQTVELEKRSVINGTSGVPDEPQAGICSRRRAQDIAGTKVVCQSSCRWFEEVTLRIAIYGK